LSPQYQISASAEETTLRNFEFRTFHYPEPVDRDCSCPYEAKFFRDETAEATLELQGEWPQAARIGRRRRRAG
jgi:hypothetical protein